MPAAKNTEPSAADLLAAIQGVATSLNERMDEIESKQETGVKVEAEPSKPAAKRSTKSSKPAGNRFTPGAVMAQSIPLEVGADFDYHNQKGDTSYWTVTAVHEDKGVQAVRR